MTDSIAMLAFLDNGFFIFLIIALLSAVSDWISKRRQANEEDDSLPAPPAGGRRESRVPDQRGGPRRKVPRLFEHLEQELKRLAEDSPIVEVLETPSNRKAPAQETFRENDQAAFGISDPLAEQKKKLAEAERLKKEAASKLANAKRLAKSKKVSRDTTSVHGIPQIGVNPRKLRHWVRNSAQLRTVIALNTILETPKGLQNASSGQADRGF